MLIEAMYTVLVVYGTLLFLSLDWRMIRQNLRDARDTLREARAIRAQTKALRQKHKREESQMRH